MLGFKLQQILLGSEQRAFYSHSSWFVGIKGVSEKVLKTGGKSRNKVKEECIYGQGFVGVALTTIAFIWKVAYII
ncbi:hypothetical protein IMZ48_07440 [Candidatus Bathyarchaeota archaeon]|nr:hypothetical protein [Candidatus Bathyarchaeota archaeon]